MEILIDFLIWGCLLFLAVQNYLLNKEIDRLKCEKIKEDSP